LGGRWAGPRWSFTNAYTPQGTNYARHTKLDYFAQSYEQDWNYAASPHTQLVWSLSAQRFPERAASPQAGGLSLAATAAASQSVALATVLSGGSSSLNLSHATGPHTTLTAGVNGTEQYYATDASLAASQGLPAPSVLNSQARSLGGNLGWSEQLTKTTSVQLAGAGSQTWFVGNGERVRYGNLQASLQHRLGAAYSVQLGGGPAWTRTVGGTANPTPTAPLPSLGYAANAALTGTSGRSNYGLSWSHADTAGLVPGSITTDLLALQYGMHFGRSWSASVSVGHSSGHGVTAVALPSLDSAFGSGQINYRVASGWSVIANASYFTQMEPTGVGTTGHFRRLQAAAGIAYQPGGAR
ncbi:MAG: hypothetical protein ACRD1L_02425, partial [Terriglobales bacterium]